MIIVEDLRKKSIAITLTSKMFFSRFLLLNEAIRLLK